MKKTNRQQQKEQTRQTLLKAAYQVFSQGGILNARMSDIAQSAGVSHGTVFAHFATQEALITEVIETYGGQIASRTHELAGGCERMEDMLRAHLAGIAEFEPFYSRLVIENRMLPTRGAGCVDRHPVRDFLPLQPGCTKGSAGGPDHRPAGAPFI